MKKQDKKATKQTKPVKKSPQDTIQTFLKVNKFTLEGEPGSQVYKKVYKIPFFEAILIETGVTKNSSIFIYSRDIVMLRKLPFSLKTLERINDLFIRMKKGSK